MEVVETPTFWCPHVERAACTNFSPRTVELRPPESREIFPFLFSSFSFSLPFSLRTVFFFFLFFFFFSFPSFLSFLLFFSFSHFISFPFHFLPHFLSHLDGHCRMVQEKEIPFSLPQSKCMAIIIPSLFLISLFLFMTSSTTWLNMSHGIHFPHMANCEPFL